MIFTIGYSAITPAKLAATVRALDATLIDVRSSPRSRRPGFGGRQLAELLGERYRHEPKLGGRTAVDLDLVRALVAAHDGPEKPNIVLMCMEDLPMDCHRFTTICEPYAPQALHVLNDCLFTNEAVRDAMEDKGVHEPVGFVP
jgi:hypothetical protein